MDINDTSIPPDRRTSKIPKATIIVPEKDLSKSNIVDRDKNCLFITETPIQYKTIIDKRTNSERVIYFFLKII